MSLGSNSGVQIASPIDEKPEGGTSPPATTGMPTVGYGQQSAVSRRARTMFYLRLFLFFLIEAGFIALGAVCLVKPVPLHIPLNLTDSEVKSGFTVIFIVWHSLAIIAGGHILADAFSREWSVQLEQLVPGTTDKVSTVTAGFLDRIIYFFAKRASGTFKLAFMASLSFMALTQLAPGSISAATTLIDFPTTVNVGTLVSQITTTSDSDQLLATSNRANLIVRLELLEHTPFSLKLPPNRLISLPSGEDLEKTNGTLEYDTDVVEFNHDCHWEAPTIFNDTSLNELVITAGGQAWHTTLIVGQGMPGSSISPLSLSNFQLIQNVSLSAYLFIGGNSTYRNSRSNPETPFAIDLGDLPTLFLAQGVGVSAGEDINLVAPLASVLICDPHTKITGGRVSLSENGTVEILSTGQTVMGNFPNSAANIIFSNALQVALVTLEPLEVLNLVNNVGSSMFMANASVDWNTAQNIQPLDIPSINKQVDMFMGSAAKAFLDGYRKDGTTVTPDFDTVTVQAVGQNLRLALTTSKGLYITSIVVIAIALALLYALCRSALTQKRYPFDLHNVVHVLREDDGRRQSLLVTNQPRRESA